MKHVVIIAFGAAVVLGLYFLLKGAGGAVANTPLGPGPVVAFGDSLVRGKGAAPGNDFVSVLGHETGREIVNLGISGDTSADGLARIDTVLALKPSLVIVLFGGNDFLRKVPVTETFSNLDMIVEKLQANGAAVVLLGIQGGVLKDPFAERFEELSRRRKTAYVPNVLSGMIGNQSLMADAVHPNDAGYEKVAGKVLPALGRLLR